MGTIAIIEFDIFCYCCTEFVFGLVIVASKIFLFDRGEKLNTTRISNFFAEIRVVSYAENLDLLGFSVFLYFHAVFVK